MATTWAFSLEGGPAYLNLVALDAQGNAFVTGATNDPSFPATGAVFGSGLPSGANTFVFAMKFAADGSKLIFSRLIGAPGSNRLAAAAVDGSGNLTIAGNTTAAGFPVTANVYSTGGSSFLSRISADGSQLIWSTRVGVAPDIGQGSTITSMALDGPSNVYVVGTAQMSIQPTPGALQAVWPARGESGGWAIKLSSDATHLLYGTDLAPTFPLGVALDSAGNAWISGFGYAPNLFGLPNAPASNFFNFAMELNANASAVEEFIPLIAEAVNAAPAFDSGGNLLLLGAQGNLLRVNPANVFTAPAVLELLNAAIPDAAAGIAPGDCDIVRCGVGSSHGNVRRPRFGRCFSNDSRGRDRSGGERQGSFAIRRPLPDQLSSAFSDREWDRDYDGITTPSGALPPMYVRAIESVGVFGVLNPDNSVNSSTNPAPRGSVVSLFVSGLGQPGSQPQDGAIAASANNEYIDKTLVVQLLDTGVNALFPQTLPVGVLYAGAAPGEINGLDQVNVLLPADAASPTLQVVLVPTTQAENPSIPAVSNSVTVFTK